MRSAVHRDLGTSVYIPLQNENQGEKNKKSTRKVTLLPLPPSKIVGTTNLTLLRARISGEAEVNFRDRKSKLGQRPIPAAPSVQPLPKLAKASVKSVVQAQQLLENKNSVIHRTGVHPILPRKSSSHTINLSPVSLPQRVTFSQSTEKLEPNPSISRSAASRRIKTPQKPHPDSLNRRPINSAGIQSFVRKLVHMSAITDPHDVKKTAPAVAAEPMNRDDAQKNPDLRAVQKVSFDLLHQFLATIASKKYTEALDVCAKILKDDPNNPLILEYEPLIREKLELDAKHGEADSDGDVGDNGSGTENDSEANSSSDEDDEIGDGSELSDSSGESINNNED